MEMKKSLSLAFLLCAASLFAAYPSFTDMTNYVVPVVTNATFVQGTNSTNFTLSVLNAATNFTILATNSLASTNQVNSLGTNFSSTSLRSIGIASQSVITNGGVVWYFYQTNANPSFLTAPNGSICTTTNGQMFVRSNSAWVGK